MARGHYELDDVISGFADSPLVTERAGAWVAVEALHERLIEWCGMRSIPLLPTIGEMSASLAKRGFPTVTVDRRRVVMGLALAGRANG